MTFISDTLHNGDYVIRPEKEAVKKIKLASVNSSILYGQCVSSQALCFVQKYGIYRLKNNLYSHEYLSSHEYMSWNILRMVFKIYVLFHVLLSPTCAHTFLKVQYYF